MRLNLLDRFSFTCAWMLCVFAGAGIGNQAAAPPAVAHREIAYGEALSAGARFPEPTLSSDAQAHDGCRASSGVARSGGMLFGLHCSEGGGARSTHPAYVGFRLQNGWKVEGTRVVVLERTKGKFDLQEPAPGSSDPELTALLSAESGGDVLIEVCVKVAGPRGTDYYR